MELHKAVGEMNATLLSTKSSVDGLRTKVDDLVGWKNKILGGAAVLAVVVAVIGFVVGKVSEYVTLKPASTTAPAAPQPPQPQPTPSKAP